MWENLWPWLLGAALVVLIALALWLALRRPRRERINDLRLQAFDLWLDGDLVPARDALREYVREHPEDTESYFQLASLMRLTGEHGRAAALYQSLAVRADLPPWRRMATALNLAENLVDLGRHEDARKTLEEVAVLATRDRRWYRLRFAVALGANDADEADRVLQHATKRLSADHAEEMARLRAAWLADDAFVAVRAGELDRARDRLRRAKGLAPAAGRVLVVKATLAAAEGDADATLKAVTDGLLSYPQEMAPAMRLLKGALIDTGRFTRLLPILESACERDDAPAALWAALARIYEKLGRREDALRLLAGKRGDPRLTPNAAAPFLRLLTAEYPDAAFSRVWNLLSDPSRDRGFHCARCGRREDHLRWFCTDCLAPDSFALDTAPAVATATTPAPSATAPPRF